MGSEDSLLGELLSFAVTWVIWKQEVMRWRSFHVKGPFNISSEVSKKSDMKVINSSEVLLNQLLLLSFCYSDTSLAIVRGSTLYNMKHGTCQVSHSAGSDMLIWNCMKLHLVKSTASVLEFYGSVWWERRRKKKIVKTSVTSRPYPPAILPSLFAEAS